MENGSDAADTGLLEPVPLDSEIFKDKILSVLRNAHMYTDSERSFCYTSMLLVNNCTLQDQYTQFCAERSKSGYTDAELEESFGFLLLDDESKVRNLSETGLMVGYSTCFTLGDPSKGVYVSKYSDCLDLSPWYQRKTGYIMLFRLTKGRIKAVSENYTQNYTQPTVGFDCHVSEQVTSISSATCSFLAYERTQYYLYELGPGDQPAQRPRQVCPFAAVAFIYGETVPTSSVLQELSYSPKKTVFHYRLWSGQLQIGSLIFPVALSSSAGALLPSQLPATLKIESLIRVSDLKQLLPQAVFETCFRGEVCLEGWYCSLHTVLPLTAEKQHFQLRQKLKDRDLAFVLRLNDSGFLVFLHSSFFFPYEDTMSSQEDVLQGLFVFRNSRVVQKDMKNWRSRSLFSPEILKALPGLHYAEAEVEKCLSDQLGAPCFMVEKQLQTYATFIQPGMRDSPPHEANILPDQYDVPDVFKHLRSAPGGTEASHLRLLSYLNRPENYSLPVAKVVELLEAGKDDEVIDLDNDIDYCFSSPEDTDVTATGPWNGGNSKEGLGENQISICTPGTEVGSAGVGGEDGKCEEHQTVEGMEAEMEMFVGALHPTPPEPHGKVSILGLANLECPVGTAGAMTSSVVQDHPLSEDVTIIKSERVPSFIGRQTGTRRSRRRKRRKQNVNTADLEAPGRRTYRYGLRTIITDCGRIFIPHGSKAPPVPAESLTDVETVMNIRNKEIAAGADGPLVPRERVDSLGLPQKWADKQTLLLEATEQQVSHLGAGQAQVVRKASKHPQWFGTEDGQGPLRKTVVRQTVSMETENKEVQPSVTVDSGQTIGTKAISMERTVGMGDKQVVPAGVAGRQTVCVGKRGGQVIQTAPCPSESYENIGTQPKMCDKKQLDLSVGAVHQKGKRKNPLSPISPSSAALGDFQEAPVLGNTGSPRAKRAKSHVSENEVENVNINCGNTVAPALTNILQSDSRLRKVLASDPDIGEQVEKVEGSSKVRTWLRRTFPRKSDFVNSEGMHRTQKSSSLTTMTDIEKLVKPLKRQLRNGITKYIKKKGWFTFDPTSSCTSDKLTQPQAQEHNSTTSGGRGGGGISGTLFVASRSPEMAAGQSPDALTLLADLALSATGGDKLLQGLSPVLGAKLATGGQNDGAGLDGGSSVSGSVLDTFLGRPLPGRRLRRSKRNLPLRSPPPKGLVVTGELVSVIPKEHSYSLVLGLSGLCPQVPPPDPSDQTELHCSKALIVHESNGASPSKEGGGTQEMSCPPTERSHCRSKGRRRRTRCWRRVLEVDGLLHVTRLWKEKYEFCLDSKYTNNPLDKTVTRALHGPWDSRIEETFEQVHLILHMWIGLFYSRPTPRFFQTDPVGEVLRGPSPDREIHAAETVLEPVFSGFGQDFHTTEPEEQGRISEKPLSPSAEVLDLSQYQLEVLDLSVPKHNREESLHVASETESLASLHKPDELNECASTDLLHRSMVTDFYFKECRNSVDIFLDEVSEKSNGNSSDFQEDDTSEWQHLSEPLQNDTVYDELCNHTAHMYISRENLLKGTCEGKQHSGGVTTVASQSSDKSGGRMGSLRRNSTTFLQPCKFTNTGSVSDVTMPTVVVSASDLEEDKTKECDGPEDEAILPTAVCDGKVHTSEERVVRSDRSEVEGGKNPEMHRSIQDEMHPATLDQNKGAAKKPLCDGHNSSVAVDLVESSTSVQWSHIDEVSNSSQDSREAAASKITCKSPTPTLDKLPGEHEPCSFDSSLHTSTLLSSHSETQTSSDDIATRDLAGPEISDSSLPDQHVITDIHMCPFDAFVQDDNNKPSPDSTCEPSMSSIDKDQKNVSNSGHNSGVVCSKSPPQVSQEGSPASPFYCSSGSNPSSSHRGADRSSPTSTSQENPCCYSDLNPEEGSRHKGGSSDYFMFKDDQEYNLDRTQSSSRNMVPDESHSAAKGASKGNVAYDDPEPFDDKYITIDYGQRKLHTDLLSPNIEMPLQKNFVFCPMKRSENSYTSAEEKVRVNDNLRTIRYSLFTDAPQPVNYDSDSCDSLSSDQDPLLCSAYDPGSLSQRSVMAMKPCKNQECSFGGSVQGRVLSKVPECNVSMESKTDPDAKFSRAEELRKFVEGPNEEVEDEEYVYWLERGNQSLNRLPEEDSGSENNTHSGSYFSGVKSCKPNEFLDNRQKNNIELSYKKKISEKISDSPVTGSAGGYKQIETNWMTCCSTRRDALKLNELPAKEDRHKSATASPIITVFDHKGNRMTYENYPIVKPVSSRHVRMIDNSSVGNSHLRNFLQTWEELHLKKPDITQETMDLEYLIFSEKINQIIKNNQKTKSSNRSSRYTWRRQHLSDVNALTSKSFAVGRHVSRELQSTQIPFSRRKVKVDPVDKTESKKREAVFSMPYEPPLRLRRLSHLDCKSEPVPKVLDITAECASSYHAMMSDICSSRKHMNKLKSGNILPLCVTSKQIDFFGKMEEETFKDLKEKLNTVVRLSHKTKFRFYILVTSVDGFFEETKELLVAEGHVSVKPEEFDLGGQGASSPLLIIVRNEDITEHICTIPQLLELKMSASVLFAGVDQPEDVLHLTHQELFCTGGFVVCDTEVLCSITLDNMKNLIRVLEQLSRKGKWLWLLHYRDKRLLKEKARSSADAQGRKQLLDCCQETGLVETVPYHSCDIISRKQPDYLHCMVQLQAQHIMARLAVFITATPDNNFENYGILAMNMDTFLQISWRISTLAEF